MNYQIALYNKGYWVDTDICGNLSDRYQELRPVKKVKGKDALTRRLFKAIRLLYYE